MPDRPGPPSSELRSVLPRAQCQPRGCPPSAKGRRSVLRFEACSPLRFPGASQVDTNLPLVASTLVHFVTRSPPISAPSKGSANEQRGGQRRAVLMHLFPERQGFHLLTLAAPKPRLVAGGIRSLMVPLGQLGHEAKAASSGRTQVGGYSCR
jgi:hypothetical protein